MGAFGFFKNLLSAFRLAFTTLTCIPLPRARRVKDKQDDISRSVVFFPLVGLFYGAFLFAAAHAARLLRLPLLLACFIIQIIPYALNKFFHFDGLCDVMDAFWYHGSRQERLRILKDPHSGSFALGGIIFFMLLKFILLYLFLTADLDFIYLLYIPVFSKFGMVVLACSSVYPRAQGTGKAIIGRISGRVMSAAALFFLFILGGMALANGTDALGWISLLAIGIVSAIFIIVFRFYSYAKIGGVTGDVLGAAAEILELIILAAILLLNWGNVAAYAKL